MSEPTIPPDSPALPAADPDPRPDDLVEGMRFSHRAYLQTQQRVAEVSASLFALMETLVVQGVVPLDEYQRRLQATGQREAQRSHQETLVTIDETPDKYALQNLPQIDCAARIPLCKARCCTLVFSLSHQDLDEGKVRWEYGKPYQIRRRADGYCSHNEPGGGGCGVYAQRPAVCRTYDCRNDRRIWIDFENRVPAP